MQPCKASGYSVFLGVRFEHGTSLIGRVLPSRRRLSMLSSFVQSRAGVPFRGLVPKLPLNFEEIVRCAHGNFEDQNKILESSIIIINYRIIIINAYYDTISAHYN
jgi:hypothetical protein